MMAIRPCRAKNLTIAAIACIACAIPFNAPAGNPVLDCLRWAYNRSIAKKWKPPTPSEIAATVEAQLGRKLTSAQIKAIDRAANVSDTGELTPYLVRRQDSILIAAGFKHEEIDAFRNTHLIAESMLQFAGPVPEQIQTKTLPLRSLNKKLLKDIHEGKTVYYVVDAMDQFSVSLESPNLTQDSLWVVSNGNKTSQAPRLITEAGTLKFNSTKHEVEWIPEYGVDIHRGEAETWLRKLEERFPGEKFSRETPKENDAGRIVDCAEIMQAQSSGKSFMLSNYIASNAVFLATVGFYEGAGPALHMKKYETDRFWADLVNTNVGTLLGSYAGKTITLAKLPETQNRIARATSIWANNSVQREINSRILTDKHATNGDKEKGNGDDAEDRARRTYYYDNAFSATKLLFLSKKIDDSFMYALPKHLYNSCVAGNLRYVRIAPTGLRLMERFATQIIYIGGRMYFAGQ